MKIAFVTATVVAAAAVALLLATSGCTQTALQREQCRYWNTVTDRLDFNRGTPRRQVVEVRTRTTEIRRTATDK